jgi:hypothetical protein
MLVMLTPLEKSIKKNFNTLGGQTEDKPGLITLAGDWIIKWLAAIWQALLPNARFTKTSVFQITHPSSWIIHYERQ